MRWPAWLLMLLGVVSLVLVPTGPSVVGAQPAPPAAPGPGLGTEPGRPVGTPVRLQLPAGYTLRALRGGTTDAFTDTCRGFLDDGADLPLPPPPACGMAYGEYAVTLELVFDPRSYVAGQDANHAACADAAARTWSGWVLAPIDGLTQNLLVPVFTCPTADGTVTPLLTLPAPPAAALTSPSPTILEFSISGYCLNHSRHAPEAEHAIDAGVLTTDPGLVRIVAALAGKQLTRGASRSTIQDIIWTHTDGEGLTDADLATLHALP